MNKKRIDKITKEKGSKTKKLRSTESFFSYLMQKEQKFEFLIFAVLYFIIFIVIKVTYPYPATTGDSGNYIYSAKTQIINCYRPIGYSWFISFFHYFSDKVTFLFTGQFLLNAIAQITFIFSIKYFFRLKGTLLYIFSALFILSPSIIFSTNYIMSDSVFNSLTLIYLATAFWIIKQPNALNIILHVVVLYLLIKVRYAALFYPILSFCILLLHSKKKRIYILVSLIPIIVGIKIYNETKSKTKEVYGLNEFSGFNGWATANNAVSIIPYIQLQPNEIKDRDSRVIHQIVTSYPDSVYQYKYINKTSFMWSKSFPGKKIHFYYKQNKKYNYNKAWIYAGMKLRNYSSFLINRYPMKYFRYYLFQNFKYVFYTFKIPNVKKYTPDDLSKEYFQLKIDNYDYKYSFLHKFNTPRKIFTPILWVIFLISVVVMFIKNMVFQNDRTRLIVFILIFLISYVGFSVIAHPINNFRYLIPIYCFQLLIPCVVLNKMLSK